MADTRTIRTLVAAARIVGVTPGTIRLWLDRGWLRTSGPWTAQQVRRAAERAPHPGARGIQAAHGTPSRWRAGCPCDDCLAAHNAEIAELREAARFAWWADREKSLLEALASGERYSEALERLDITAQAVTAHRRRSPAFAAALDQALMAGRDPDLQHGAWPGWKGGCRCPECRELHEQGTTAPRPPSARPAG